MSSSKPVAAIVPHTKTKGIDICGSASGTEKYAYIIRSDLHCYMKCTFQLDYPPGDNGQKYEIHPLHPACSGGDHYVSGPSGFNIIRGDSFITVNNLSAPKNLPIQNTLLSDLCKGGDNYLYSNGNYKIIKGNKYTLMSDLASNATSGSGDLHSSYANGLYYFGIQGVMDVMIQDEILGVMFSGTVDPQLAGDTYLAYPNVISFLPGGLSINYGTTMPKWVILKSFTNSSKNSTLNWSETITKTVGYNKSHFESLEKSWSVNTEVSMSTSFESGFFVRAALRSQFSLSTSYGGTSVKTDQEDWNEAYTTTEQLSTTIGPGESVYIWQFRMGLKGSNDVLFCRDLQLTNSPTAPTSIPLVSSDEQFLLNSNYVFIS